MGERGAKMGGPCGVKKGKSKKIKLHRKYREETLVRQHHKKVKKVARKAKAAGIKAPHKREPLMSNSSPFFKDQFPQAGFTKSIQEVKLDSKVTLIDSPGVLLASEDDPDFILRNCTRVDKLTDTTTPVEAIIKRCQKEQLLKMYQIGMFSNVQEFLVQIAEKRGRMMKGGRPDLMAAGRTVLEDWNSGKVPFYTLPPAAIKVSAAQASVVSAWGKEFNLDAATEDEIASVESLAARQLPDGTDGFMAMESSAPIEMADLMDEDVSGEDDDMMMDDDEDDEEGDEDNEERYEVMV